MSYDSGWLSPLRLLALAVAPHLVPRPADPHVAPAPHAVLGGVVKHPAAPRIATGLETVPPALRLRTEDLSEQPGHDALHRIIPDPGPQVGAPVRPETHPQSRGGGEAVQALNTRPRL